VSIFSFLFSYSIYYKISKHNLIREY
jgi:hypothetical protein